MNFQAKGYDEMQFNEDLAELERLLDKIKKLQGEIAEKQGSAQASITSTKDNTGN